MSRFETPQRWEEAAPFIGGTATSSYVLVPGLTVPERPPSTTPLETPATFGWVQEVGATTVHSYDFPEVELWLGREVTFHNPYDSDLTKSMGDLAQGLLSWSRINTFPSFEPSDLGIVLEYSDPIWSPPEHTDQNEFDALWHIDQVRTDIPIVGVLGAIRALSRLHNGDFKYLGGAAQQAENNTLEPSRAKYVNAVATMKEIRAQSRRLYATDARTGLHAKRTLQPGFAPFRRPFVRAFIARVPS